jgi:hypothetical protein
MTQRLVRLWFLIAGAVAAATGIAPLAGCASDDAVSTVSDASSPQAGTARKAKAVNGAALQAELEAQGPRNTGTYPNLNIKPQVANEQISPEETASDKEALTAAKKVQGAKGAGIETTDPAVLKKLAETHAEETLKAIDAQK